MKFYMEEYWFLCINSVSVVERVLSTLLLVFLPKVNLKNYMYILDEMG